MSMTRPDLRWLCFQVGVPLVIPIGLSAAFVYAWKTLDGSFKPNWAVIVDVSPWAIAVYSLTLIGSTFDRAWSRLGKGDLSFLWIVAAANAVYYAFLVIKRYDGAFVVPFDAYYVTVVLMVASIIICYRAR